MSKFSAGDCTRKTSCSKSGWRKKHLHQSAIHSDRNPGPNSGPHSGRNPPHQLSFKEQGKMKTLIFVFTLFMVVGMAYAQAQVASPAETSVVTPAEDMPDADELQPEPVPPPDAIDSQASSEL